MFECLIFKSQGEGVDHLNHEISERGSPGKLSNSVLILSLACLEREICEIASCISKQLCHWAFIKCVVVVVRHEIILEWFGSSSSKIIKTVLKILMQHLEWCSVSSVASIGPSCDCFQHICKCTYEWLLYGLHDNLIMFTNIPISILFVSRFTFPFCLCQGLLYTYCSRLFPSLAETKTIYKYWKACSFSFLS